MNQLARSFSSHYV